MREIKFRAYNEATGKIYQWSDIKRLRNLNKLLTLNHVQVMQYTGLKDSQGNEIYEGDILSDYTETDEGIIKSHRQVFWNESHGCWSLDFSSEQDKSANSELWLELYDFDYEISGNIHQNKELLYK